MSRLLGAVPWTRQPPAGTPVAPEFRKDLAWLFTGEGGVVELTGGIIKPTTTTAYRIGGKDGPALNFGGTSSTEIKVTGLSGSSSPTTVLAVVLVRSNTDASIFTKMNSGGTAGLELWLDGSGYPNLSFTNGTTDSAQDTNALSTNFPHVIIGRHGGAVSTLLDLWIDDRTPTVYSTSLGGVAPQHIAAGAGVGGYYLDGELYLLAVWNRLLPDAVVRSLMRNPWQIFAPQRRLIIALPTVTAQYARPTSDASAGTWTASTGSDLYAMLDETAANDADYIVTTGASTCEVALGSLSDPAVSTGHKVRYRLSANTGGITVRLRQGTTTIATWTHSPAPASLTTYEQTLTGGEADSITNYAALKLQFEATT